MRGGAGVRALLCGVLLTSSVGLASAPITEVPRRDAVVKVVENTAPSVVSITTEQQVRSAGFPQARTLFEDFFRGSMPQEQLQRTSLGSGVIIDVKGHVLTNEHVVRGASRVTVTLSDERVLECDIIGVDPDNDLAVLRIKEPPVGLKAVRLGTSSDLLIGETVVAIGNPFGLSQTVTTGVVSARDRSFTVDNRSFRNFIQTDAAINPGNSGGPLLNIQGELIGINTAIFGQAQGLGFAIPVDRARRVVESLIQFGQRVPGWLGMEVVEQALTRRRPGDPSAALYIAQVQKGGPADRAGVRVGDRLMTVDRSRLLSREEFGVVLRQLAVGDEVDLTVQRGNSDATLSMKVRSVAFPSEAIDQLVSVRLGFQVTPVTAALATQYGLFTQEGLMLTEIKREGQLARLELRPGDVIRQVDGNPTRTVEELRNALTRSWGRSAALFHIQRGRIVYAISVPL